MQVTITISVGVFLFILALLVFLRSRNSKFEIRPTDIVVAILPVIMFLLITGKIQKFEISESGVKIETAFIQASSSTIASQVSPLEGLPSEPLRTDAKGGVEEIPRLIEKKTEGLLFRLGQGGYWGPAIQDYFVLLAKQPFLRYIVIENQDKTFFAMANARELTALLMGQNPPYKAVDFAQWLNKSDKSSLAKLPGFISSENAVTEITDKSQALQLMESLNIDTLPVVNKDRQFTGVVNRSRLTASLIIDVTNALKK